MTLVQHEKFINRYNKKRIAIKNWLLGAAFANPEFNKCLIAFYTAEEYHTGFRKDGITPEFNHQLNIIGNIITNLKKLNDPVTVLCVAFMHDLVEDYGINAKAWNKEENKERLQGLNPVTEAEIYAQYGATIAKSVNLISKEADGAKKSLDVYYDFIANDEYASIAKLEDRYDNLISMVGVFTEEKQLSYVNETITKFIPMLKTAQRRFPHHSDYYQEISNRLKTQCRIVLKNSGKDVDF